ncbi:hypothetical protein FRB90_006824 [Tulasnella sp. 427]|nr:hypothetical protein FRB90_006824 [Tulasnella sp. 427]
MLSVFNIIRLSIFSAVIAWSLIVIGVAGHLNTILIANEYTRFIPLAIFIAVLTFLIIPTLIVFGFVQRPFILQQVRMELAFTGFLGLLWFILGIYTATSPDTEVECDFDGDGTFEESDEFSTDTFYAQFHCIEAFAIFNAILLFIYFFLLLLLSLRQHRAGYTEVWREPATTYPWFGVASGMAPKGGNAPLTDLPAPVLSKGKFGFGGKGATKDGQVLTGSLPSTTSSEMGEQPMKAGGHYIIYIPPPAAARK